MRGGGFVGTASGGGRAAAQRENAGQGRGLGRLCGDGAQRAVMWGYVSDHAGPGAEDPHEE